MRGLGPSPGALLTLEVGQKRRNGLRRGWQGGRKSRRWWQIKAKRRESCKKGREIREVAEQEVQRRGSSLVTTTSKKPGVSVSTAVGHFLSVCQMPGTLMDFLVESSQQLYEVNIIAPITQMRKLRGREMNLLKVIRL